jgi:hypothetical protein
MAGDLATMKARIARELARPDLTTQIADAINDAISIYAQERFRFSETSLSAPPTFNTVAGQAVYGPAANANISTMFKVDWVNMAVGGSAIFELIRDTPENLLLYNEQSGFLQGQPSSFAYRGNELLLSPVPDKAYAITLGLFLNVPAPAGDGTTGNPWMTDGELLIRSRAKFEIATHVTRNAGMAQAMSPDAPMENGGVVGASYRAWKMLKGTANRVVARGIIRPMAF